MPQRVDELGAKSEDYLTVQTSAGQFQKPFFGNRGIILTILHNWPK